ncbi:MAG TPA: tryptophanase [Limnochordales bacterium]
MPHRGLAELPEPLAWAEPYRTKMVEPVPMTTREERQRFIAAAGYNPFRLRAEQVSIDLLTDSGTAAMSDTQWAALMRGDESYAGSRSFVRLQEAVAEVLGFPYVLPTHQGRAAENVLFHALVQPGQTVPNNMHFDTTKAHVHNRRARPVNLIIPEGRDPQNPHPFKGNMDVNALETLLEKEGANVPLILLTVTCNNNGGQPVSMDNIRAVSRIARRHGVPLFLDAARFAENAYFIKQREPGYRDVPLAEIVREMMGYADGCAMSAKKDGLVNIGGFVAFRDEELYRRASQFGILYEGFLTYGGLSGRDMEALAAGLREVLDEHYLAARVGQVRYLWEQLAALGIPLVAPAGGHGVYVDAARFLPHFRKDDFPGWSLSVALYEEAGVRACEIGTVLAGRNPETGEHDYPEQELLRLAIPRRVYSYRHMDVVAEGLRRVWQRREALPAYRFVYEPPVLRHFTATFAPEPIAAAPSRSPAAGFMSSPANE